MPKPVKTGGPSHGLTPSEENTPWDQETYIKAWEFAARAHLGQKVPGSEIPYLYHIGLVSAEAMAAASESVERPNLLVICAVLHDVIEDTPRTYQDVLDAFGRQIADGVLALSKKTNLPTKEAKMKDSLDRITKQPGEIWMVKLCDRITNLQPPPPHWDSLKIKRYRDEANLILEQLGNASPYLSKRLHHKIKNYGRYM